MKKPNQNATLMVDAIKAEAEAAHKERRSPNSSNVLRIFAESSRNRLTHEATVELFDTSIVRNQ